MHERMDRMDNLFQYFNIPISNIHYPIPTASFDGRTLLSRIGETKFPAQYADRAGVSAWILLPAFLLEKHQGAGRVAPGSGRSFLWQDCLSSAGYPLRIVQGLLHWNQCVLPANPWIVKAACEKKRVKLKTSLRKDRML